MRCEHDSPAIEARSFPLLQSAVLTVVVIAGFVATKNVYDGFRRRWARLSVVVIGGGPIGLTALLIAARTRKVSNLVLYEELTRSVLINKANQIALESQTVSFLRTFGVDFENLEGCWSGQCFFTRVGIFQEYLLSIIKRLDIEVDIRLGHKFTRKTARDLETTKGRLLVVVCDGSKGLAAQNMGLSDDVIQHSCKSYAATAAVDRPDQRLDPLPEKRVFGLNFDLSSYGTDTSDTEVSHSFSLKLFGTKRHRFMSLTIPKCDSTLVKTLRVVINKSMMRNIFLKCFNSFKNDCESHITESCALKFMKFSPRLFEIKLSQRRETIAYYEDLDIFVLAEGDAARCYNFHTGMDANVGMKGLESLFPFIEKITLAETEHSILDAMLYKSRHADQVCKQYLRSGLKEFMYRNRVG